MSRDDLLAIEREFWACGLTRLAGVDEAGLGPLAGPVVAAAVVMEPEESIAGVFDSKALTPATRERLEIEIQTRALSWAIAVVEPDEIDRINVYQAGLAAMSRAVAALDHPPDHVLLDGRAPSRFDWPHDAYVKGDARVHSIAAASILAKVERDRRMIALDEVHPGYGFAGHKGYGSAKHLEALKRLGPCPIHRRSFGPVAEAAGLFSELYDHLVTVLDGATTTIDIDRAEMRYVEAKRELKPIERRRLEKRIADRRKDLADASRSAENPASSRPLRSPR